MKKRIYKKKTVKSKPLIDNRLDSHKWATKIEIQRLFSGKPDLIIEADAKTSN
ncbi:MAG: hypothetical protein GY774_37025 [Planctomycetes bacterium]|nr:hypothetical protein [Planctomycetota bacterium]